MLTQSTAVCGMSVLDGQILYEVQNSLASEMLEFLVRNLKISIFSAVLAFSRVILCFTDSLRNG